MNSDFEMYKWDIFHHRRELQSEQPSGDQTTPKHQLLSTLLSMWRTARVLHQFKADSAISIWWRTPLGFRIYVENRNPILHVTTFEQDQLKNSPDTELPVTYHITIYVVNGSPVYHGEAISVGICNTAYHIDAEPGYHSPPVKTKSRDQNSDKVGNRSLKR